MGSEIAPGQILRALCPIGNGLFQPGIERIDGDHLRAFLFFIIVREKELSL